MGYPKLTPIVAAGATEPRYAADRFADRITPKDFGAKGDGTTDDSAAFAALEEAVSGRMVDLCGLSYATDEVYAGNTYCNGSFVVSGKTYPAYAQNVFAYWDPAGIEVYGAGDRDLNFFICDGKSTPASIKAARDASDHPYLKDVIAIGNMAAYGAIQNNTYLADCIALGCGVMSSGEMTGDAQHNIGIGQFSLKGLTSGTRNVAIGSLALLGTTSGSRNVAIGRDAAQRLTTGSRNTLVGYGAMCSYGWADFSGVLGSGLIPITGSGNTIVGSDAAYYLSGGSSSNVFIGKDAGRNCKIASDNTVVGEQALLFAQKDSTIGGYTFVEEELDGTYVQSGTTITVTMAGHHAVAGRLAVINFLDGPLAATQDSHIAAVASVSGSTFTFESSVSQTIGGTNTCQSVWFETATETTEMATENSVLGRFAGAYLHSVRHSVFAGTEACRGSYSGSSNTVDKTVAIGAYAHHQCTSAELSVSIGYGAARNCPTMSKSICIGPSAGNRPGTLTQCVFIGQDTMYHASSTTGYTNDIALGYQAAVTGNNQCQLGNSNVTTYAYGSVQNRSDGRDKADVKDTELGLDFLLSLRPVDFRWDYREDYVEVVERDGQEPETVYHEKDGSRKRTRYHHGLIAQEVKAVLDAKGIDFGGYQDHKIKGGSDVLSLGYEEFIAPIIKAIQQINARLEALEGA